MFKTVNLINTQIQGLRSVASVIAAAVTAQDHYQQIASLARQAKICLPAIIAALFVQTYFIGAMVPVFNVFNLARPAKVLQLFKTVYLVLQDTTYLTVLSAVSYVH